MLDNKTKERIAKEAEKAFPTNKPKEYNPLTMGERKLGYIAGAEAEATRAAGLIEAYRELHDISNDLMNEMEKHIKGYEPTRAKVARGFELLRKIEALTKYNNPVNK